MSSQSPGRTKPGHPLPIAHPVSGEAHDVLSVMNSMLRPNAHLRSSRGSSTRGFTLVELMIVVAIVGILAALGLVGFRKYMNASHSTEAVNIMGSIRNAQESYRAETLSYLNVSGSLTAFYPRDNPDDRKMAWGGTGIGADNWKRLNVQLDGPTLYAFATVAGLPGTAPPVGDIKTATKPNLPTAPVEPWYVIQGIGDVDADDVNCYLVASSFSSSVYVENDDE